MEVEGRQEAMFKGALSAVLAIRNPSFKKILWWDSDLIDLMFFFSEIRIRTCSFLCHDDEMITSSLLN
jgi:hypothetical protein